MEIKIKENVRKVLYPPSFLERNVKKDRRKYSQSTPLYKRKSTQPQEEQ